MGRQVTPAASHKWYCLPCGLRSNLLAFHARDVSPNLLFVLSATPRSLTPLRGGKWGVWGEGGEASGSPHSFTANIYGRRGP